MRGRIKISPYLVALAAVALAAAVRQLLNPILGHHYPYLMFYLAVSFVVWQGTTGSAVLAAVAGLVTALYCFVPLGSAAVTRPHVLGGIGYLIVTFAMTLTGHIMRRAEQRAHEHAGEILRTREALRESQARLQITFERAAIGIVEAVEADRFAGVNDRACEILGYTREEMLATSVHDLTYPDDRPLSDKLNAELHAGLRDRIAYDKRYVRKDGSPIWLHVTVSAIRDERGRWERSIATIEEIEDRKRAEEAVRASERKYRRLHETMQDAFASVTMDGRINDFNEAFCRLLGYEEAELRELRYQDITPAKWHAFEAAIVAEQVLPLGASDVYEKEYRRKDGSVFPVELRTSLICDDQGRPFEMWATVRDITERKRAEEALRRALEDLRAADRKKDEYLAILAHELRNPIAAIGAAGSLLLHPGISAEKADFAKQALRRRVHQLSRLIEDLLDMSRIARGKIELHRGRTDLAAVIHAAVEATRAFFEERRHSRADQS